MKFCCRAFKTRQKHFHPLSPVEVVAPCGAKLKGSITARWRWDRLEPLAFSDDGAIYHTRLLVDRKTGSEHVPEAACWHVRRAENRASTMCEFPTRSVHSEIFSAFC